MQRLRTRLAAPAIVLALLAPIVLAAPVAAGPMPPVHIDPVLLQSGAGQTGHMSATSDQVSLIVRLYGPTLWHIYRADQQVAAVRGAAPMTRATLQTLEDAMERRQQPVARAIEATGADVVASYQAVTNGLLVHATRAQIPEIARISGVSDIAHAPILTPDLDKVIPTIQADKVYQELGIDGTGATVAVIDTGIDYDHQDFGGAGSEAYASNNENIVEPGTFPTAKVVGGYDIAGEYYTAACPDLPPPTIQCTNEPMPDDDPLDPPGQGHGTHVSGIAAGMGVSNTVSAGVAPGASLVALKVFGDPAGIGASTDLATSAIEWVTEHNMGMRVPGTAPAGKINVINMSLGAAWGGETEQDNAAISSVVEAGVSVVASAGNSGPYTYIAGNPSGADMALSVASSYPGGQGVLVATAKWQENGQEKVENEDAVQGAEWLPQLDATGPVTAQLAWYGLACNDANGDPTPPVQDVNEKIALIQRGSCAFYDKIWNAAKMGAVAAVVFNNATTIPIAMGCGAPSDCFNGPDIPAVMIGNAGGMRWRQLVESGTVVTAILDASNFKPKPELTDVISDFSSRGPARFTAGIKPQITAPGSDIFSAAVSTGTGGVSFSGTSMSSPAVAGVAALLWERNLDQHLNLGGADIAALVMNYAEPVSHIADNQTGPLAAIARQGAGRVNAYFSAKGTTLVRSEHGIAELNFGNIHVTKDTAEPTQRLVVRNLSTAPITYKNSARLAFPQEDTNHGVDVLVQPQSLTVAAGMTGTVEVTVAVNPTRLRAWQLSAEDAVSPLAESDFQELEVDGFVNLTEVDNAGQPVPDGDNVGVPFYSLPRRHACLWRDPASAFVLTQDGASAELPVKNSCPSTGALEVFRMAGQDPAESQVNASFPAKLDITSIGLRYGLLDFGQGEEQSVEFAIRSVGSRRIPVDAQFRIYLDFNRDGKFDRMLFNVFGPAVSATAPPGSFAVISAPVVQGTLDPDLANPVPFTYELYDVDETSTKVVISVFDLDPEGEFNLTDSFEQHKASFGLGAQLFDDPEDYIRTDAFPGYDDAPNGLKGTRSPMYIFDQAVQECVKVETPAGDDLVAVLKRVQVPGNRSTVIRVTAACPAPAGAGKPVGLLLDYEARSPATLPDGSVGVAFQYTNLPGETAAEVQPGYLGKPRIYLPLSLQNYDWEVEAEPTPTAGTP